MRLLAHEFNWKQESTQNQDSNERDLWGGIEENRERERKLRGTTARARHLARWLCRLKMLGADEIIQKPSKTTVGYIWQQHTHMHLNRTKISESENQLATRAVDFEFPLLSSKTKMKRRGTKRGKNVERPIYEEKVQGKARGS